MTFNPAAAMQVQRIAEIVTHDYNSAIEFGNQRYTAQDVFKADSTKDFYNSHGFAYLALDVNTDKDAAIFDFNESLEFNEQQYNTTPLMASLVTNIGTSEHVFDQAKIFQHAHDLCLNGGIMFHQLPFTTWINHGFFNYNPIFFQDLAAANNYKIEWLELTDRWGREAIVPFDDMFVDKKPFVLESAIQGKGNLFINCVYRKQNSNAFQRPFQGKYKSTIKSDYMKATYAA
jgi:hypothetical protein